MYILFSNLPLPGSRRPGGLLELPGLVWAAWALLGAPWRSWALLGAPGRSWRSWALLGAPGRSWALLGAPGRSWALLSTPGRPWALLGAPGRSWASSGAPPSNSLMVMAMVMMMVVPRLGGWVPCLDEVVGFVFGFTFLALYVGGSGGGGPQQSYRSGICPAVFAQSLVLSHTSRWCLDVTKKLSHLVFYSCFVILILSFF